MDPSLLTWSDVRDIYQSSKAHESKWNGKSHTMIISPIHPTLPSPPCTTFRRQAASLSFSRWSIALAGPAYAQTQDAH